MVEVPELSMRHETTWYSVRWHLVVALILVVFLCPISPFPIAAKSIEEYFQIRYELTFSKNENFGSDVFYATIRMSITCIKDLIIPMREVSITGYVVAEHTLSEVDLILNSSYTAVIGPIPCQKGEIVEIIQVVPLQFPPKLNLAITMFSRCSPRLKLESYLSGLMSLSIFPCPNSLAQ